MKDFLKDGINLKNENFKEVLLSERIPLDMSAHSALGAMDYVVIGFTMVVSVAIGVYFRFTGSRQKTINEFLMGGRDMGRFPVVFSLAVTKLSGIAIVGEVSDIYLYGTQRCIAFIFIFVGCVVTAFVFLPVYYSVGSSTIYEFLEQRYGRRIRRLMSVFCYIHTLLNMSVVMYTPAIALNAVTNLDATTSLLLVGVVSILFSGMGGLKAVMWADVFQALMMYLCLFTILIQGMLEVGSVSKVYEMAYEGDRLNFFNFVPDPQIPYTFWNSLAYGVQFGVTHAINQFEIQRLLAVKTLKNAQSAALWSSLPSFAMSVLITTAGLTMYAVFRNCNPLAPESGTGLTKSDQIVPYYAVSRLMAYPGLAGLCISGILSASISTLSSALNALSTVVVDDFMRTLVPASIVKKIRMEILAKALVLVHGAIIVGLAFLTSLFQSILQGVIVLDGMILGPTLAIYLLGVLTTRTNEKGALVGLVCGALFAAWFGMGTSLLGPVYEGKPLYTDQCLAPLLNVTNLTCCAMGTEHENGTFPTTLEKIFPLYGVSYIWTYCSGAGITMVLAYIASCFFNFNQEPKPVDPDLLCPLVKRKLRIQIQKREDIELETK